MHFRWLSSDSTSKEDYAPVDTEDDISESSSIPLKPPRRSSHRYIRILPIIFGALLGASVTLLALKISHTIGKDGDPSYDSPIPEFPKIIRRFSHGSIFGEPPSPDSDAAWGTLEGPTYFSNPSPYNQVGHIRVDGSAQWDGIEAGHPLPDGTQKYSVSYAHQLHCLGAIRRTTFQLLDGSLNTTEFLAVEGKEEDPEWIPTGFGLWHLTHCLDYVRQALQCAGDTSLEWARDFSGVPVAIGWDIPHKCVDWNKLQKYMEDNG